jgi:hypothetical protein
VGCENAALPTELLREVSQAGLEPATNGLKGLSIIAAHILRVVSPCHTITA